MGGCAHEHIIGMRPYTTPECFVNFFGKACLAGVFNNRLSHLLVLNSSYFFCCLPGSYSKPNFLAKSNIDELISGAPFLMCGLTTG